MADGHTFTDRPFLAEAEAIVAAQREARAQVLTGGVSWGGLTSELPPVEDVETVRQRIAPLLQARADQARKDALISVAIRLGGNVVITNLDALAREFGLPWSERKDIREALAAGVNYAADETGGWSKLPKNAVLSGAATQRSAA